MDKFEAHSQLIAATAATAGGVGSFLAGLAEVAQQLFGVPLPVLLAAMTGACGVRVFLPPAGFWLAFSSSVFWTFTGAFSAQFVLWLTGKYLEGSPPSGALAFMALLTSAFGQRIAPIIWVKGGAWLERWFDHNNPKDGGS